MIPPDRGSQTPRNFWPFLTLASGFNQEKTNGEEDNRRPGGQHGERRSGERDRCDRASDDDRVKRPQGDGPDGHLDQAQGHREEEGREEGGEESRVEDQAGRGQCQTRREEGREESSEEGSSPLDCSGAWQGRRAGSEAAWQTRRRASGRSTTRPPS